MNKKIKYYIRDALRFIFGVKGYTVIRFVLTHKYFPNFKKPKSWTEKIIYRKFDNNSLRFSSFVDKYTVREFIEQKVGGEYLVPLYKHSSFIKEDDFIDLPMSFVIKTSNGGGGENVLIVDNKLDINIAEVCDKFNRYLTLNVGNIVDEHFYDIETPYVIFEELLKNKDGTYPSDYKCHVFNSHLGTKVFIQVDSDRFSNHKRTIYNEDYSVASFNIQPKYQSIDKEFKFPPNMDELLSLVKKIAEDFKYVRVDMYNVDGIIYFGEMTFCHGSGWEPLSSKADDFMLGSYWDEYNK